MPVPVEYVAHRLGLRVESVRLGEDVSGLLVLHGNLATIGYNEEQSLVRQRFTVAHELGHFCLHAAEAHESGLFIDKKFRIEYWRDGTSSTGSQTQEIEANRFAASLLMPEELVRKTIIQPGYQIDEGDDDALQELASKFEVSVQAMSLRLASLGLFESI
jgi:Zn-dependent peptidase ImmA (M78 family)